MGVRDEARAIRGDPGTTLRYPTLRKGKVTSADPFEVDSHPALDITGQSPGVGAVVWMLIQHGQRLVIGAAGLALGEIGYAEVTSNQTGITTETDLTGLSVTVDVPAGRRVKVTSVTHQRNSGAANQNRVRIYEDAAVIQELFLIPAASGTTETNAGSVVVTPSSGSRTYKLTLTAISGTAELRAAATVPSLILVEDVGGA